MRTLENCGCVHEGGFTWPCLLHAQGVNRGPGRQIVNPEFSATVLETRLRIIEKQLDDALLEVVDLKMEREKVGRERAQKCFKHTSDAVRAERERCAKYAENNVITSGIHVGPLYNAGWDECCAETAKGIRKGPVQKQGPDDGDVPPVTGPDGKGPMPPGTEKQGW